MFLSFYTFIILIVQVTDSVDVNNNYHRFLEPLRNKVTLPRIRNIVKKEAENKKADKLTDETKFFDYIQEESDETTSKVIAAREDNTLCEIKRILQKLLVKLNTMERSSRRGCYSSTTESVQMSTGEADVELPQKKRHEENLIRRPRWGQWTPWSSCSVSCGKGREIRWRHCLEQCDAAETEMEEKTCQLPACGPGKLFGIKL